MTEPSVTTSTCVVVLCADCRDTVWEDTDGLPHWPSLAEAVKVLDGWDWLDPARPVCPRCRVRRACAAAGHLWGTWRTCGCGGRISDHESGCRRFRVCEREIGGRDCGVLQEGDRVPA